MFSLQSPPRHPPAIRAPPPPLPPPPPPRSSTFPVLLQRLLAIPVARRPAAHLPAFPPATKTGNPTSLFPPAVSSTLGTGGLGVASTLPPTSLPTSSVTGVLSGVSPAIVGASVLTGSRGLSQVFLDVLAVADVLPSPSWIRLLSLPSVRDQARLTAGNSDPCMLLQRLLLSLSHQVDACQLFDAYPMGHHHHRAAPLSTSLGTGTEAVVSRGRRDARLMWPQWLRSPLQCD
ncbi:uncharacterized protein LOC124696041 [Lolium rigidum]|uniref:uncharacterized protein LOC124696041 n=1 Tax=Lolium rigidum TaxID=89674 RepID=UPI001F5C99CB|nr:uncharacterized protein LOC124696041 [Lolium rigidum]